MSGKPWADVEKVIDQGRELGRGRLAGQSALEFAKSEALVLLFGQQGNPCMLIISKGRFLFPQTECDQREWYCTVRTAFSSKDLDSGKRSRRDQEEMTRSTKSEASRQGICSPKVLYH